MPSPMAMHRFWNWLNANWPNDRDVNTKIFNYVSKYISPFKVDGTKKPQQFKRYGQRRLNLLEAYLLSKGRVLKEPEPTVEIEIPQIDHSVMRKELATQLFNEIKEKAAEKYLDSAKKKTRGRPKKRKRLVVKFEDEQEFTDLEANELTLKDLIELEKKEDNGNTSNEG